MVNLFSVPLKRIKLISYNNKYLILFTLLKIKITYNQLDFIPWLYQPLSNRTAVKILKNLSILAIIDFRNLYQQQKQQSSISWCIIEGNLKHNVYKLNYQLVQDIYICTHQFQKKYPDQNIIQFTVENLEAYCGIKLNSLGFDFADENSFPPLYTPLVSTTIKAYLANRVLCDDQRYINYFGQSQDITAQWQLIIQLYCDALNAFLKDENLEIDDTNEDLTKIIFDTKQLQQTQDATYQPIAEERNGKEKVFVYDVKQMCREDLVRFITSLQIKK